LKGRVSVYPDSRVWIVGVGFFEGSPSDLVAGDAFLFGVVFVLGEALDVTSVRLQMDLFFAGAAFAPSAQVIGGTTVTSSSCPAFTFVDVTTFHALFVSVADGGDAETPPLQVVVVALVSEEFSVTQSADLGGFGKRAMC